MGMIQLAELHEQMWRCKTIEHEQKLLDIRSKMALEEHRLRVSDLNGCKERKLRWYWTYSELIEEMLLYLHEKIFKKDGSPRQKNTFDPWIQVLYEMPDLFVNVHWKLDALPKECGVEVIPRKIFEVEVCKKLEWLRMLKYKEKVYDRPEIAIKDVKKALSYLSRPVRVRNAKASKSASKSAKSSTDEPKSIYEILDQAAYDRLVYPDVPANKGDMASAKEETSASSDTFSSDSEEDMPKPAAQKPVTPKPAARKPVTPKPVTPRKQNPN